MARESMTPQEEAVTVIQAEELRALIAKATDDDLSDGGRYFSGSCDDLTRCRHEEIGEYQHASDGVLIEWLWNRRHAILDRFTRTSSSDAATPDGWVLVPREPTMGMLNAAIDHADVLLEIANAD